MPKVGEKQSNKQRNYALKRKKGFKGTQKQEVAQKRRKETRAVEVTFVREDDVVSEQILGSGAVLVYRYTGEFLLFSYPYMEL